MSVASSLAERADAVQAGTFASTGAALLRHLAIRSAGGDLLRGLTTMEEKVRTGSITLAVDAGVLHANNIPVPREQASAWLAPLSAGGVVNVLFEEGSTARELLLFLALLAAPGDSAAFASTWLASGSWRIHVGTTNDSLPDNASALAPAQTPDTLEALCGAVMRGDARSATSPVVQALRSHGSAATDALLQALTRCTQGGQRRLFFDAIVVLGEGAEHLMRALQHDDWHVARNAAALLGELKVEGAALLLAHASHHPEFRVRVAAITSLGQLHAPVAREALLDAVKDRHPGVRARAWLALADGTEPPTAGLLDAALRHDDEPEVHHAALTCAAAFPTLDVSTGLVRFCARAFSQRASKELLVFGVEQLAVRRPDSAKAFVSRLPERLARTA